MTTYQKYATRKVWNFIAFRVFSKHVYQIFYAINRLAGTKKLTFKKGSLLPNCRVALQVWHTFSTHVAQKAPAIQCNIQQEYQVTPHTNSFSRGVLRISAAFTVAVETTVSNAALFRFDEILYHTTKMRVILRAPAADSSRKANLFSLLVKVCDVL